MVTVSGYEIQIWIGSSQTEPTYDSYARLKYETRELKLTSCT